MRGLVVATHALARAIIIVVPRCPTTDAPRRLPSIRRNLLCPRLCHTVFLDAELARSSNNAPAIAPTLAAPPVEMHREVVAELITVIAQKRQRCEVPALAVLAMSTVQCPQLRELCPTAILVIVVVVLARPAIPRCLGWGMLAHMLATRVLAAITARMRDLNLQRRDVHHSGGLVFGGVLGGHYQVFWNERIHFRKWICILERNTLLDTMAPLWMIELMERGEMIEVMAHEPSRNPLLRKARRHRITTWTWLCNKIFAL